MDGRDEMQSEVSSTKLTYEDYLLFPDDGQRHELIDGEHFVTPAPNTRHQRVLRRLANVIENWLESHPVGEMFFAPFDVVMSKFDVVEPDLIYLSQSKAEQLKSSGLFGSPDLVVEILSPTTRRHDAITKRQLYERREVEEYWVIDPELDTVKLYRREGVRFGRSRELTREDSDVLSTPLLPGLEIPIAKILA